MKQLYFKDREEWRKWLSKYYDGESGIWLIFYKKESGKPSLKYEEAVEEALCFGWIDSIIKKKDESTYLRKFTPRKDDSKWSALNKKRVERMIQQGKITEAGMAKIRIAKENGMWNKDDRPNIDFSVSPEFSAALEANPPAKANFKKLAPSHQKQYTGWINIGKRPETKEKRIAESIALLKKGEKLGLR